MHPSDNLPSRKGTRKAKLSPWQTHGVTVRRVAAILVAVTGLLSVVECARHNGDFLVTGRLVRIGAVNIAGVKLVDDPSVIRPSVQSVVGNAADKSDVIFPTGAGVGGFRINSPAVTFVGLTGEDNICDGIGILAHLRSLIAYEVFVEKIRAAIFPMDKLKNWSTGNNNGRGLSVVSKSHFKVYGWSVGHDLERVALYPKPRTSLNLHSLLGIGVGRLRTFNESRRLFDSSVSSRGLAFGASSEALSGVSTPLSGICLIASSINQFLSINRAFLDFPEGFFGGCGISCGNGELSRSEDHASFVLIQGLSHQLRLLVVNRILQIADYEYSDSKKYDGTFRPIGPMMSANLSPSPAPPQDSQYPNSERLSSILCGILLIAIGIGIAYCALGAFGDSWLFGILLGSFGGALLVGGICVVMQRSP